MSITPIQKSVIDAIVSLHETGRLPSPAAYSTVAILRDGAGISYGKHQSTDRSDSLDAIVYRYCDKGGLWTAQIIPFLSKLRNDVSTRIDPENPPQWTKDLMSLLAEAGKDPLMQEAQDEVFDEGYWTPAVQKCTAMKLSTPLAHLAVYDTCIQSGPGRVDSLRNNFREVPPSRGGEEQSWVQAFLLARRNWLRASSNPLVRRSVYRVDAMLGLVSTGNWDLSTPFSYRGTTVV